MDVLLSMIGLLATGWIIVLAFIFAKIDTRASGMFLQQRVGKHGKPFNVMKIRTMRISTTNISTVTSKDDDRITVLGTFFRKTKIDELPQLLNVLKGDMSIVGPRPTVQADYDKMNDRQKKRADVLPGITGLAQIKGNTSLLWPERIEYDLEYIEKQNLQLDCKIIFKTIVSIITRGSDTHPAGNDEWQ